MRLPNLTIAGLMIIVLVVAISIAALRESRSEFWASAMFTLTVIVLTTATLGSERACPCRS